MKQYTLLPAIVFLAVISLSVSTVPKAFATVGGPTYIYNFKYNPSNESVYYTKQDMGGRGCPPELISVSLNSEKSTTEFSCDKGETMSVEQVNSTINKTTSAFKPLTLLPLKDNSIAIDVKFVKVENYSPEVNEVLQRHFLVSVYQNGIKVKEFPITGCAKEQPFIFQGYAIPGFNKKIALLVSAKNNCFEGGYIFETLQIVGGVDNLKKPGVVNFTKGSSALAPNEGTLVVYEADVVTTATSTEQTGSSSVTVPETSTGQSWFTRFINWLKSLF